MSTSHDLARAAGHATAGPTADPVRSGPAPGKRALTDRLPARREKDELDRPLTVRDELVKQAIGKVIDARLEGVNTVDKTIGNDSSAKLEPSAARVALSLATNVIAEVVATACASRLPVLGPGVKDLIAGALVDAFRPALDLIAPAREAPGSDPSASVAEPGTTASTATDNATENFFIQQRRGLKAMKDAAIVQHLLGRGLDVAALGRPFDGAAVGTVNLVSRAQAQATRAQYYGGLLGGSFGRTAAGGADMTGLHAQRGDGSPARRGARGLADIVYRSTVQGPARTVHATIAGVDLGTARDIARGDLLGANVPLRLTGVFESGDMIAAVITRNEAGEVAVGGRDRDKVARRGKPHLPIDPAAADEAAAQAGAELILREVCGRPLLSQGILVHSHNEEGAQMLRPDPVEGSER